MKRPNVTGNFMNLYICVGRRVGVGILEKTDMLQDNSKIDLKE